MLSNDLWMETRTKGSPGLTGLGKDVTYVDQHEAIHSVMRVAAS